MRKTVKGIPIMTIAVLALSVVAVGAILVNLYISQIVQTPFTFTEDIRGLNADLLQATVHNNYHSKLPATFLDTLMFGVSNLEPYDTLGGNTAILVIDEYDIPTEDLTLSISMVERDTENPISDWTCVAEFVQFYHDGSGRINTDSTLAGTGPIFTIPNAKIEDMVYDNTQSEPSEDYNALMLNFLYTGPGTSIVYSDSWEPSGIELTEYDIIVTLSVDDGV